MKKSAHLLILTLAGLTLVSGCSKKTNTITLNENGIEYVYKPAEKPGVAASFAGEDIPESQILSQSPALQELMSIEEELHVALLYFYALNKHTDELTNNKKVTITVFKTEIKKPLPQILAHLGLTPNKNITVSYAKPLGDENIVGNVNGTNINKTDLNLSHFRYYGLKKRQFREKLSKLQGILVRRALLKAASDDKQNIEEFINKNIITSAVTVSDADVAAFMKKNNIADADINDDVRGKIKQIVEEGKKNVLVETYVSNKLIKDPVVIYFNQPAAVYSANPSMSMNWGYESAPIAVTVFSDFQCQTCMQTGKDLIALREKHKGQLKISFNHFFSENDRNARMLAEASMCVLNQKNNYFGKFYDEYVSQNLGPDEQTIYDTVTKVGANLEEFKKCFLARTYQNQVTDHLKYASSMGVTYAPTIIIDDEVIEGGTNSEELAKAFQRKVDQKGDSWFKVIIRRIFG